MTEREAPQDQLTGYAECLRDACTTGRRMTRPELEARRAEGERAAELGLMLRVMIREHLTVSQEVLTGVPIQQAGSLLAATEQAVDAFVEGYERAQH
ncbi:PucR family transcriptional regulator, partial [Streptomyces sp. NPDC059389]